jgi:hypothetical protein
MKPSDLDDPIRDYLAGASLKELVGKYRVSFYRLTAELGRRGIKRRSVSEATSLAVGRRNVDALVAEYLAGVSIRELARKHRTCRKGLVEEFLKRGVKMRGASERMRLVMDSPKTRQAISEATGAAMRTEESRRSMSESTKSVWAGMDAEARKAQTAAAHDAVRGKPKSMDLLMRSAATRYQRMLGVSPREIVLHEAIRGLGYRISPQLAVGPYNLDLALEECGVSVEVERETGRLLRGKNRPGDMLERTEYLCRNGWSVLFVIHYGHGFVIPDIVQKILAFLELAGRDKPFHGQYGVVRRDGKPTASGRSYFDGLARVPGF